MSLDGQIRVLAKGLHESPIDMAALLQDKKSGKIDFDLFLKYASFRDGYEKNIIAWASAKYKISKIYLLKTTASQVIGKIDLTENNRYDSDEISYGSALRKLQELGGLKLGEESQQILECCEGRQGYNSVDAMNLLVSKKLRREIDIIDVYLQEKGFEKGKFERDGEEITGEIPESFLGKVDTTYVVASSVFGKHDFQGRLLDNLKINVDNGRGKVVVSAQDLFPFERESSPITDKKKACEVLTALSYYVIW